MPDPMTPPSSPRAGEPRYEQINGVTYERTADGKLSLPSRAGEAEGGVRPNVHIKPPQTEEEIIPFIEAVRVHEQESKAFLMNKGHGVKESVSLFPPYPAYWRQVLTDVIYDAIHHPPGGPKNVPPGQIAEAVVARLRAAFASPEPASENEETP
jgi:hypothetical protein